VSDGLIAIGRDANASFYYFKGSLDDFGIWDRALSPTEVQTLYTSRPSVTWSTGANTNSITVSPNQSTTYYVTVSDGVTTCTDSVRVNVFNQNFNPLPDTLRLCGRNATLDAGEGYTTYQWNTGATTRTINVTSGGFYRVTVTNPLGCSASDSTYLSLVNARILNNDTAICVGSIIRLSIDSTFPGPLTSTVTWSTGATTNSILVNPIQSTTYSVSVTNGISTCTDDVIVNVSIVDTSLQVIGSASFCELDSAVLRAGVASSYQWLRNGVVISGATSREYVARVSGVYRVVLSTSIGCTDTSRAVTITVNPRPRAQFTTNSLVQCMRGNVFVFTNQSTLTSGAMTYQWDFGNGQTSALASPSYSYAAPGSYLVMLSVFSNAGCRDTASVVVTVNPQPVAAFTVNDSTQCINGNLFSFTNQSSISSGSISYLWNFGNGVVSAQANPQHVYTQPGNYTVTLYVTSGTGCVDSASRIMTVYPKPNPSFTVNATPQCLSGNSFVFTNTTTIAAGTVTYTWYYGNGASSVSLHGAQAYALPGVYTVKLVAVSDNGCRDSITQQVTVIGVVPQAAFTVNNPSQCLSGNSFVFTNNSTISAGTMTYAWSFGNGQTSTLVNPVHTYTQAGTYTVTLIASSTNGCRDTTRQFVIVRPQPQPSFTVNSSSQCQGTNSFVFTNTSSIATGSMTYQWRFGDGQGSTQASPTHSYTQVGTYTVTLIAVSEYGCIDSIRQAVVVNYTPSASFTINSASQCLVGNSFVFTSTSTITAGTLSYLWRLGNGATSTASTLTYSYSTAGTYTVTLVVTSNSGCRDSVQRQVVVKPNPVPSFTINDNDQCLVGNSFVFTNTSTLTAGTMQYRWRYGNGQEATTTNAAVTYAVAGTYTVTLVATSDLGCVDSVSRQVIVRPMPVGGVLSPTVTHICDGGFLTLTASGGSVYQWYLNGVAINGATAPTYNATVAGLYTVDLISAFGCLTRDTVGVQLRLIRKPVAAFTYDRYCAGTPTQFTNTSTINSSLPVSYSWLFGSNAVSTMENPVHTFIVSGFYDVQLKVVPTLCPNLADSVRRTLAVEAPLPNERYPGENAIINQPLQLSARAISRARYLWLPSIGLSNDTIVNPVFTYNREQEYRIRITTQAGCVMTDTLLVRIFSGANIFVPEGFSPNGDGVNDVLRPRLVGIRRLIHFKIFNRWGQLMYETGREGQGWDGIYRGVKQPLETYVWMIQAEDIEGNIIKRTGSTLLLR
jgi:gliding motility-associated-like protein